MQDWTILKSGIRTKDLREIIADVDDELRAVKAVHRLMGAVATDGLLRKLLVAGYVPKLKSAVLPNQCPCPVTGKHGVACFRDSIDPIGGGDRGRQLRPRVGNRRGAAGQVYACCMDRKAKRALGVAKHPRVRRKLGKKIRTLARQRLIFLSQGLLQFGNRRRRALLRRLAWPGRRVLNMANSADHTQTHRKGCAERAARRPKTQCLTNRHWNLLP